MGELIKIPQGWSVKEIHEIGEVITGSTPKTGDEENWIGTLPFVSPTDLTGRKFLQSTERQVNKEIINKNRIIPKNSIMYTCIASIGKMTISNQECTTNQQINTIIPTEEFDYNYLYYSLLYKTNYIKTLAAMTAVPIINKGLFSKIELTIPPLKEQQKIAAILSSVDETIEKTEQIIEQIERVKKGLMQELLTKGIGKTEFKDSPIGQIPLSWEAVRLDSFANEVSIRNKELEENFVLSCTKYDGIVSSLEYFDRQVFSKNLSNYKIIKKGQFAYATIHLDEGSIGLLEDYESGVISPMYTIFKVNNTINKDYLMYQLKSYKYIQRYQRLGQGSVNRRMSIPFSTLKSLKVHFPPFEEQEEIVKILQSVEKRILAAKKDVQSLNKIKQGLMQELLTGKKRVKVEASEEVLS